MSMPKIPDLQPKIDIKIEEVINMLLASIALEEISLANLINAQAEKIQEVIKNSKVCRLDDLIKINVDADKTLKDIIKKEILLEFKFDNILELIKEKDKGKDKDKKRYEEEA